MAYIDKDGTLVIMEGDTYILEGDTLVFLKGREENGIDSETEDIRGAVCATRKCEKELS